MLNIYLVFLGCLFLTDVVILMTILAIGEVIDLIRFIRESSYLWKKDKEK